MARDVAQWGDYDVHFDQLLGRGGMGSVYRARQRSLDRWVAIKVLDTSHAADPALVEGFRQRFPIEIAALSRLNDSRIVTILQAGENDGRLWFAMELIEGRTVEEFLGKEGAFSEAEARRIASEVARALDVAARQGIVHRDVKPGNIFLQADGGVKLADFGLARVAELGPTRMTEANAVACTPAYASPEQAEGGATDKRSDLYSLGCVLYEMVTERPPFSGESNLGTLFKHALKSPTLPRVLNPKLSEDLEAVILRCLEKEPDERYQDYPELLAALEPRTHKPEPPRAWIWPAAAAAGLALLAVILTAIFTDTSATPPPSAPAPQVVVKTVEVQVPVPVPVDVAVPAQTPETPAPPPPVLERPRPTEADLVSLRALLAASRETLADRSAYRFEDMPARELTPWAELYREAERERLASARAAFLARSPHARLYILRDGRTLEGEVIVADAGGVTLDLGAGRRQSVPYAIVSPVTFSKDPLARIGAGDAASVLTGVARLDPRHGPGAVDQAIEEVLRAADAGDLRPLLSIRIPKALREAVEPMIPDRLRLLDEERSAAELHPNPRVLLERAHTRAGALAVRETLSEFRRHLRDELVGEISFGGWAPDLERAPNGAVRFDHKTSSYVLTAPGGEWAWVKKELAGARKGYRVGFRCSSETDPRLAVALTERLVLHFDGRSVTLAGRSLELRVPPRRGELSVIPRPGVVSLYLDDRLLFVLPEPEGGLDGGIKIGAGGGTLILESIRVLDRTHSP